MDNSSLKKGSRKVTTKRSKMPYLEFPLTPRSMRAKGQ
jgi:hypothetical protein